MLANVLSLYFIKRKRSKCSRKRSNCSSKFRMLQSELILILRPFKINVQRLLGKYRFRFTQARKSRGFVPIEVGNVVIPCKSPASENDQDSTRVIYESKFT